MITYHRVTSVNMAARGYHRYEVRNDGQFVGEVFNVQFGKSAQRWVAQRADGSISGIIAHLWTRKAATVALLA